MLISELSEDAQIRVNTLNSLLPQQMPFVVSQVTAAIKLAGDGENFVENLDVAISIAEQLAKFSTGDLLYNYVPVLVALLKDTPEGVDLSPFETVNNNVAITLSLVKTYLANFHNGVKHAANKLCELYRKDKNGTNAVLVILATLDYWVKQRKDVLPIAYTVSSLASAHLPLVNEWYAYYCDLLSEVGLAEF